MTTLDLDGVFVDDRQASAVVDRPCPVTVPSGIFKADRPGTEQHMPSTGRVVDEHAVTPMSPSPRQPHRPPTATPSAPQRQSDPPAVRRLPPAGRPTSMNWPPPIGSVIDGKYELVEHVGSGGFAEVYRAVHRVLRNEVALKILKPKVVRERPEAVDMMCNEARMAVRLAHRNIVGVIDITRLDELVFIVMEYVDGATLSEVMEDWRARTGDVRMPEAFTLRVAEGVCAGLDSACRNGAIHRDIKPSNIMIQVGARAGGSMQPADLVDDHDAFPKIVDLGLARASGPHGMAGTSSDAIGTPLYMPPEQVMDPGRVDHRSDMYALGCTLFHMLSGRPPYDGHDAREIMRAHMQSPVPDTRTFNPRISDGMATLIAACMAKERDDRPRAWGDILDRLAVLRKSSLTRGTGFLSRITERFGGGKP